VFCERDDFKKSASEWNKKRRKKQRFWRANEVMQRSSKSVSAILLYFAVGPPLKAGDRSAFFMGVDC
jgi:hypothetical protein